MNAYSSSHRRFTARLFIALFACLCGVDSVCAESTDPGGGIGGTGITGFGVVQKFGSIFVNGREYFLDGDTRISRDGTRVDAKSLQLGDVVNVQGRIDPSSGRSVAISVDSETALQGAIEKLDVSSGTLTVLGQVVRVMPATFGDRPKDAPLPAGLRPGERIAVSGLLRSDGSWTAARIARLPADESRFVLRGVVQRAEPERGRLRVNGQDLTVSPGRFPSRLMRGDRVRVDGHYGSSLRAENIRIDQANLGPAGQIVEMSGYVQARPEAGRMISNNTVLRYSDASVFIGGGVNDLHEDLPVAVRGEMQADGSVSVREIRIDVEPVRAILPDIDIRAPRERLDVERGRHGAGDKPEHERPEVEKSGAERHEVDRPHRPEIERPEIERPEIERPEIERPHIELPEIEQPEREDH